MVKQSEHVQIQKLTLSTFYTKNKTSLDKMKSRNTGIRSYKPKSRLVGSCFTCATRLAATTPVFFSLKGSWVNQKPLKCINRVVWSNIEEYCLILALVHYWLLKQGIICNVEFIASRNIVLSILQTVWTTTTD